MKRHLDLSVWIRELVVWAAHSRPDLSINPIGVGPRPYPDLRALELNKPIIAAINGYALGGGSELALSCHIRYASSKAKIGQPEVKLGIIAGWGGTQRLPKIVSKGKAVEILTSGKIYSAEECFRIGLVDDIFESDELIDKSIERAIEISENSPEAISKTLELINLSHDLKTKEGFLVESIEFGKLFQEEESIEGISAFLENRKAKFWNNQKKTLEIFVL